MFTGLIETIGTVRGASASAAGRRIVVDLGPLAEGVRLGDSINLAGCCQTVAELRGAMASFDTVPETLRLTTLGDLRAGDRVNLERSLAVGDRLGGHFVSGHVDALARLEERRETGAERIWSFRAGAALVGQMVAKGSVAIDGVSLTLVEVTAESFSVALIPTTLAATTLGDLARGAAVNIETDLLGKYVRKYLSVGGAAVGDVGPGAVGPSPAAGLSLDKLRQAGFAD